MTESMIPSRNAICLPRSLPYGGGDRHDPRPSTVETEYSAHLEWQFAECMCCGQSISRFRILLGGTWFDTWGNMDESAYLIDNSGRDAG